MRGAESNCLSPHRLSVPCPWFCSDFEALVPAGASEQSQLCAPVEGYEDKIGTDHQETAPPTPARLCSEWTLSLSGHLALARQGKGQPLFRKWKGRGAGRQFFLHLFGQLLKNSKRRVRERTNKIKSNMTQPSAELVSYQVLQRGHRFSSLPGLTYHGLVFNEV